MNSNSIAKCLYQKHLGIALDSKVDFSIYIKHTLLIIYKFFLRPHIDHGDILHEQPDDQSFEREIEKVQCKASNAIIGAIQRISRKRSYDELGLMSLKRRWYIKLTFLYKIVNGLLLLVNELSTIPHRSFISRQLE